MAITPGKAGEALKAALLQREGNYAWPMGLSVVFAERLMDLIAIVLLAAIGLKILPMTRDIVLLGIILCLLIILVLGQPTFVKVMSRLLGKLPWVGSLSHMLSEIHKNIKELMTPWLILVALPISLIAWFAECLILVFALSVCQDSLSLSQSTATYALATLAGTVSIFPGGLVTTEVSMVGLLTLWGLQRSKSVLVTFALRLCTLWFGVFVGMFFLFFLQRKHSYNERLLLEKQHP